MSRQKISAVQIQGKGRGVIAKTFIAHGDIIEVCPVMILSKDEASRMDPKVMERYFFSWSNPGRYTKEYGDVKELWTVPAGFGMLYNHSAFPNADYNLDYNGKAIIFTALVGISPAMEITINYNLPLWFKER